MHPWRSSSDEDARRHKSPRRKANGVMSYGSTPTFSGRPAAAGARAGVPNVHRGWRAMWRSERGRLGSSRMACRHPQLPSAPERRCPRSVCNWQAAVVASTACAHTAPWAVQTPQHYAHHLHHQSPQSPAQLSSPFQPSTPNPSCHIMSTRSASIPSLPFLAAPWSHSPCFHHPLELEDIEPAHSDPPSPSPALLQFAIAHQLCTTRTFHPWCEAQG